jgi:SAM-dependent methyltransferase
MAIADKDARARSFGAVAEVYDRGRPGWPAEAIEWLLGPEPLEVLDLGAGTGKLTAALVAAGHRVTALEPDAEMRTVLAKRMERVAGAKADGGSTVQMGDAVLIDGDAAIARGEGATRASGVGDEGDDAGRRR